MYGAFLRCPVFQATLSQLLSHRTEETGPALQEKLLAECRVLLAKDNELNREIAVELLSSSGALMETAENGRSCFNTLGHSTGHRGSQTADLTDPHEQQIQSGKW